MADEPETIQTHVTAITDKILAAEAFAATIEDDITREAAVAGLAALHHEAARNYRRFKEHTEHSEETQALRSPADDKD